MSTTFKQLEKTVIAGKYQLECIIGQGGFSAVYRGTHVAMGRPVAVKLLDTSSVQDNSTKAIKRFEREARVISQLQSPNTITVYDYGVEGQLFYLVMEFVDGQELRQVIREQGALEPERAAKLAVQILSSLEEAHHYGVLHRDLKPANVMLTRDFRGEDKVKVVDFGIAKVLQSVQDDNSGQHEEGLTQEHSFVGTPRYSAPEQLFAQNLSPATDIYGVGMIMWDMLLASPALKSGSWYDCSRFHLENREAPMRLPQGMVPPQLAQIVERAILRHARERYQGARQMREALEQWLAAPDQSVEAPSGRGLSYETGNAWPSVPSTLDEDSLVLVRNNDIFDPNLEDNDHLFGAESGWAGLEDGPLAPPEDPTVTGWAQREAPGAARVGSASGRHRAPHGVGAADRSTSGVRSADLADSASSALSAADWSSSAEHIPSADVATSAPSAPSHPSSQIPSRGLSEASRSAIFDVAPPPVEESDDARSRIALAAGGVLVSLLIVGAVTFALRPTEEQPLPDEQEALTSQDDDGSASSDGEEVSTRRRSRYSNDGILLAVQSSGWTKMRASSVTQLGSFSQQSIMYRRGERQIEVTIIEAKSADVLEELSAQIRPPARAVTFDSKAVKISPLTRATSEEVREVEATLRRYRAMIDEHDDEGESRDTP